MVFHLLYFCFYFSCRFTDILQSHFSKSRISELFSFFGQHSFLCLGEPVYVTIMLVSILVNWLLGLSLQKERFLRGKVVIAISFNLIILFIFKYYDFLVESVNNFLGFSISVLGLELPIGISFYTFQVISYIIDVKRKPEIAQKILFIWGYIFLAFRSWLLAPLSDMKVWQHKSQVGKESWDLFTEGLKISLGIGEKKLF